MRTMQGLATVCGFDCDLIPNIHKFFITIKSNVRPETSRIEHKYALVNNFNCEINTRNAFSTLHNYRFANEKRQNGPIRQTESLQVMKWTAVLDV